MMDRSYDEFSTELRSVHMRKYELERQADLLNHQLKSLKQVNHHTEKQFKNAQLELDLLRRRHGELEIYVANLKNENYTLSESALKAEKEVSSLKAELKDVRQQFEKLNQQDSMKRIQQLEEEKRRVEDEVWALRDQLNEANEKAKWFQGEVGYFKNQLQDSHVHNGWLENELKHRGTELDAERCNKTCDAAKTQETLWSVQSELRAERDRAKWYEGEVTYFRNLVAEMEKKRNEEKSQLTYWNNKQNNCSNSEEFCTELRGNLEQKTRELQNALSAKEACVEDLTDKVKWYEGESAHFRSELTAVVKRCEMLQGIKEKLSNTLLINKETCMDRNRWNVAMWKPDQELNMVRTQFTIRCPNGHQLYLTGSFVSWECLIQMNRCHGDNWKVSLDVPRGHHEFRFVEVANSQWITSGDYQCCNNEFDERNNCMEVK
ncbi:unnamed protein product [Soboliphyme baturini]|uniref:AMPK1_CBM domain-containing protein n=1 Tax=Soboliphyme baturini TaxID=241478 RepID=A0A183IM00_9BILA|nr:unnamed protein product [Soboliphyme baturini]